jgi:hypothetical protein
MEYITIVVNDIEVQAPKDITLGEVMALASEEFGQAI